jgi:bifunctional DNA-binding transcriptional regulator/antitoxin component of YhaV-PrlF toxin-antitoxin module
MATVLGEREDLVVPAGVRRRAGIKAGDRIEFKVSPRTITITAAPPRLYKPTKAELAAMERGRAEVARGEYVTLEELLNELGLNPRKRGKKKARKVSSSRST